MFTVLYAVFMSIHVQLLNHNFLYFILIEGRQAAIYENKKAVVTTATDTVAHCINKRVIVLTHLGLPQLHAVVASQPWNVCIFVVCNQSLCCQLAQMIYSNCISDVLESCMGTLAERLTSQQSQTEAECKLHAYYRSDVTPL